MRSYLLIVLFLVFGLSATTTRAFSFTSMIIDTAISSIRPYLGEYTDTVRGLIQNPAQVCQYVRKYEAWNPTAGFHFEQLAFRFLNDSNIFGLLVPYNMSGSEIHAIKEEVAQNAAHTLVLIAADILSYCQHVDNVDSYLRDSTQKAAREWFQQSFEKSEPSDGCTQSITCKNGICTTLTNCHKKPDL